LKIATITDIHARSVYPISVLGQLRQTDLLLIAGDITNFGDKDEANYIIQELAALNIKMFAVPGNCDRPAVSSALDSCDINLHATTKIVGNVMLFGIGGCNKTPFHTPLEYSEKEIADILNRIARIPSVKHYVLVSHAPPYKTKLDKVLFGLHVGSKAIRNFVDEFQPDIVVCGHIHEARGVDNVGNTLIINPGPFPKHYATVELNTQIKFNLY
jgi:putative phosphoesterase